MKAVFADSYYFLALLNREDNDHPRVAALSRTMFAPMVTTCWILTEVGDAMAGVSQRQNFIAFMDRNTSPGCNRIICMLGAC
jgi:hypothetical protein